jgi:prepilin-type N-terminal cleavage/methylation domain-containing protein
MKSSRHPTKISRSKGFSLLEALVVITIIGVLAAMGVAGFGSSNDAFNVAQSRRNAQEIVSAFVIASVAGVDFRVPNDLNATVQKVLEGQTAVDGAFAGRRFGVFGLEAADVQSATQYIIQTEDGSLLVSH